MTTQPFEAALLAAQQHLRNSLLGRSHALTWRPSRDLAAMMLLNLDDTPCCWSVATQWLQEQFVADRVDGGFHSPSARYYCAAAQAAASLDVPDMRCASIDTHEAAVASLWLSGDPIAFHDVSHDPRLSASLRALLKKSRTASKLATSLRYQSKPVGLICLDQLDGTRNWTARDAVQLKCAAAEVVAPILHAARQLAATNDSGDRAARVSNAGQLTASEARVARLVASGLSYKEIARELGRSHSTVDHHLRSIRQKLGVSSTSRLIRVLSEIFPQHSS